MNKQKSEYRMGVGASSVLMVLVVLVLTALGMLSFTSAKNAQVLTRRNLAMTTAYYEAAAQAQQKLAALDAWLAAEENPSVASAMRVEGISLSEENGETRFSFDVDAGYGRFLKVAGVFMSEKGKRYRVTRHELVPDYSDAWEDQYYELLGE